MLDGIHKQPLNISLKGMMRAVVLDNVDPKGEGRIKVIIPKLMPNYDPDSPPTAAELFELNDTTIENDLDNDYVPEIKVVNFFWARPTNMLDSSDFDLTVQNKLNPLTAAPEPITPIPRDSETGTHQTPGIMPGFKLTAYVQGTGTYKVPRIQSDVWIIFEDDDIQKCYYLPYAPTLQGEVTPMQNVEQTVNKTMPERKVNINVIREWANGSILYYDTNDDKNIFCFKSQNGTRFKFEHNIDASGFVLDTELGHQVIFADRSSSIPDDNPRDFNDEDTTPQGRFIKIISSSGHHVLLDDNIGKEKVIIKTMGGHEFFMIDTSSPSGHPLTGIYNSSFNNPDPKAQGEKFIKVKTTTGHTMILDDSAGYQKVMVKTTHGHTMLMDDVTKMVTIKDATAGQIIELIETAQVVNIRGGTINLN